ncbi:hypothetical protein FALCPG4_19035 [Fusarium falciforme]
MQRHVNSFRARRRVKEPETRGCYWHLPCCWGILDELVICPSALSEEILLSFLFLHCREAWRRWENKTPASANLGKVNGCLLVCAQSIVVVQLFSLPNKGSRLDRTSHF